MYSQVPDLVEHRLDESSRFYSGRVPAGVVSAEIGDRLWALRPTEPQSIAMHGKRVLIPRRQQAFGADYHFSGQTSRALPVPVTLQPLWQWVRTAIEPKANAILVNWYEGSLGHYIGPHRDSTKDMIQDAPIITVSLGASRLFRLKRWKGGERYAFPADAGAVFILPYNTNRLWTHEVPHRSSDRGNRISVTFRALELK